jgi:ADP-heptose:LPS heptosyltransferase
LLTPEPMGPKPRLLVLQLNRIGDLVLTTPALNALREIWPLSHITIALSEACQELVPALPKIDSVLIFNRKLRLNRRLFSQLLTGQFDVCLDFTGTDRSALLSLASRARKRVAFSSARKGPIRALIYQQFVQVPVNPAHEIDRMFQLIRPLGVPPPLADLHPILNVPPIARQRIARLLRECGVPGDFALIQPGSAATEKYWLPERWAEVILALQHKHQLPCVLTGGPDPFEQDHLRAIQTALAVLGSGPLPLPLVTLAGQLDLALLTALVERSRLIVSCDTAVVHMASAFRRPQVTLFGPTNPFQWRPRHDQSRVVSAALQGGVLTCFDPNSPSAPMSAITTSAALAACAELLSATAAPTTPLVLPVAPSPLPSPQP